jgi:hypothetical protein
MVSSVYFSTSFSVRIMSSICFRNQMSMLGALVDRLERDARLDAVVHVEEAAPAGVARLSNSTATSVVSLPSAPRPLRLISRL